MVVESLGLCNRIVTDITTSDFKSCSFISVSPLVCIGEHIGNIVVPSLLTSTVTADGQATRGNLEKTLQTGINNDDINSDA